MANDDLVGNLATENLLQFCNNHGEALTLHQPALQQAQRLAEKIFDPGL
jgi:hydroxymethylglutaryl-CoA lyase